MPRDPDPLLVLPPTAAAAPRSPALTVLTSHAPDRDVWLHTWRGTMGESPFAHPAYLEVVAGGAHPLCAVLQTPDGDVALPFLLRTVPGTDEVDVTSPYGYGGPFVRPAVHHGQPIDEAGLTDAFWRAWSSWCSESGVVTEVLRFSLDAGTVAERYPGERVERAVNYVRRLDLTPDALWQDVDRKVRKGVARARRDGLTVEIDPQGHRLDEFLALYTGTMDRRGAADGYYFDRTFFERLLEGVPGATTFVHVLHDGDVVSTELLLHSPTTAWSFLGGTEASAFPHRPNDLLKVEAALHLRERGVTSFVLGGGARPGDGVERYKRALAPTGAVPFTTGQRVHDPLAHAALCRASGVPEADLREGEHHRGHFPAYRAPHSTAATDGGR